MQRLIALAALATAAALPAQPPAGGPPPGPPPGPPTGMHPVRMGVTSLAFEDGGVIPDSFTMKSGATAGSPALAWSGAPAETRSFVLVMHDLDVVVGTGTGDNLHWLAYNIPATASALPAGVPLGQMLPDGTMQVVNRDKFGYNPPGAPPGVYHHYAFELWALDAKLTLPANATRADVLRAMDGHVLDKGTLVGRFHR